MPTFCRHNRFIERCPICSKTLPGSASPSPRPRAGARSARARPADRRGGQRASRPQGVRVQRELRAADDGFRSPLVPGLRSSADARRLATEVAFASGRLLALAAQPPGLYGEVRALAGPDIERASWACFLIAYLCPLEGEDPFASVRAALQAPTCELNDLHALALGPRSSHDPERGAQTPHAFCRWARQAGGARAAFTGDTAWSPQRRFERLFERLALPGFARAGRYELLVLLGRLGLFELRAASLHLTSARSGGAEDPVTMAAKRVFGIGDPLLLERRAASLAAALSVPVEALDLALWNCFAAQHVALGFSPQTRDELALERAAQALGL